MYAVGNGHFLTSISKTKNDTWATLGICRLGGQESYQEMLLDSATTLHQSGTLSGHPPSPQCRLAQTALARVFTRFLKAVTALAKGKHYHNNKIKRTVLGNKPKKPVKVIGNHIFYKL